MLSVNRRIVIVGLLAVSTGIVISSLDFSPVASERMTDSPFFVLRSQEIGNLDPITDMGIAERGGGRSGLYIFREGTKHLTILDNDRKSEKLIATLDSSVFATTPSGQVSVVGNGKLSVFNDKGSRVSQVLAPNASSVSVLSDGMVVLAGVDSENLITVVGPSGRPTRAIGDPKPLDVRDKSQNRFLNAGKVVANMSNEIFYATLHSPSPTIQRFSANGALLKEFKIEGAAVDLQAKRADEFLRERKPGCVGGYSVIRDFSIDPTTGKLWIGMNGMSEGNSILRESGILYEYSPEGEKLAQYALIDSQRQAAITDIKRIVVNFPDVFALTSGGRLYSFNLKELSIAKPKETPRKFASASLISNLSSLIFPSVSAQGTCPPAQSYSCSAQCLPGSTPQSVNCGAELTSRMSQGEVPINGSCQAGSGVGQNGGCTGTLTGCAGNGVQVTYQVTLNCNPVPTPTPPPPTPTPEPTPTPGGGGGGCEPEECADDCEEWNADTCSCKPRPPGECGGPQAGCNCSPIVLDVSGDGFNLTDSENGVPFDLNGDGVIVSKLAWTAAGSDDAWLALDRDAVSIP